MNPTDRKYSRDHEWAKDDDDGTILVGITDYAQENLGDIVFLELPRVGTSLDQTQKLGEVESVKSVSDLFSPISGEIVAINQVVVDSPEIVNEDPYDNGWLIRVKPSQPAEMDGLLTVADYESFLETLD
ncbi:MAG: glycine cleavage system protein GcvH [Dehalococcoidia bacterium]|jgi:glycine cleavage system H protein|nr:glycine cleavage system protein GcvH [Dehalococcoidia bacterium]